MRFSTGALATDGSWRTVTQVSIREDGFHRGHTGHRRRYEILADHVGYLLCCTRLMRSCGE